MRLMTVMNYVLPQEVFDASFVQPIVLGAVLTPCVFDHVLVRFNVLRNRSRR